MPTFITNNRPAPLDLRALGDSLGERYMSDHYRPAAPAAVNQSVKPASPTTPAMLVLNTPKRDEFAGYSINAAIDEAVGAAKPATKPVQAINAGRGEFAGYSINDAIDAARGH